MDLFRFLVRAVFGVLDGLHKQMVFSRAPTSYAQLAEMFSTKRVPSPPWFSWASGQKRYTPGYLNCWQQKGGLDGEPLVPGSWPWLPPHCDFSSTTWQTDNSGKFRSERIIISDALGTTNNGSHAGSFCL